jgi:hypothetical protein
MWCEHSAICFARSLLILSRIDMTWASVKTHIFHAIFPQCDSESPSSYTLINSASGKLSEKVNQDCIMYFALAHKQSEWQKKRFNKYSIYFFLLVTGVVYGSMCPYVPTNTYPSGRDVSCHVPKSDLWCSCW